SRDGAKRASIFIVRGAAQRHHGSVQDDKTGARSIAMGGAGGGAASASYSVVAGRAISNALVAWRSSCGRLPGLAAFGDFFAFPLSLPFPFSAMRLLHSPGPRRCEGARAQS